MPPPKGRNQHILVVDDNPGILNLAERMLTRLGYRVTISDSSVGALEMFRSKPSYFNLIVTDLNMPALSGNDLAEKVWGTRPGIPILAITGNSDDLPQNALRDQRFADVLLKPFSMRALGTATFRALNADL